VLYQLVDQEPLLRCLQVLLEPGGVALIADPHRSVADHFPDRAQAHGFHVYTTRHTIRDDMDQDRSGRIFRLSIAPATT